jgi:hypothetical protein
VLLAVAAGSKQRVFKFFINAIHAVESILNSASLYYQVSGHASEAGSK